MNKLLLRRRRRPINLISLELSDSMKDNIELIKLMQRQIQNASGIPSKFLNPS